MVPRKRLLRFREFLRPCRSDAASTLRGSRYPLPPAYRKPRSGLRIAGWFCGEWVIDDFLVMTGDGVRRGQVDGVGDRVGDRDPQAIGIQLVAFNDTLLTAGIEADGNAPRCGRKAAGLDDQRTVRFQVSNRPAIPVGFEPGRHGRAVHVNQAMSF